MNTLPRTTFLKWSMALAAGAGLGWMLRGVASTTSAVDPATIAAEKDDTRPATPHRERAEDALTRPRSAKHRLALLKRQAIPYGELPAEAQQALLRMKTDDLRELMLRAIQTLPAESRTDPLISRWQISIVEQAAKELYRRDPAASLEWGRQLYQRQSAEPVTGDRALLPPPMDAWVIARLLNEGDKIDPARNADWLRTSFHEFQPGLPAGFFAYAAAADAGDAAAMLRVEDNYGGGNPYTLEKKGFPDGFDFRTLVMGSKQPQALPATVAYWAAKDPEAAFQTVRERLGEMPGLLGPLFCGVIETQGSEAAAKWMGAKLAELPPEQRSLAAAALAGTRGNGEAPMTRARVEGLISALTDENDRLAFAVGALRAGPAPGGGERLDQLAVKQLGSEDLQIRALIAYANGELPRLPDDRSGRLDRRDLNQLESALMLSDQAKEKIAAGIQPAGK